MSNIRQRSQSFSNSDTQRNEYDTSPDPDNEDINYDSAPSLVRDINVNYWKEGFERYSRLHSHYLVWKNLTYALPFYIISISVATVTYFTQDEFLWFCIIMPFSAMLFLHYVYHTVIFTKKPCISNDMLCYYPGYLYKYGIIVYIKYSSDENENVNNRSEYQYWIVYNERKNAAEFISVKDEEYNLPHVHTLLITE